MRWLLVRLIHFAGAALEGLSWRLDQRWRTGWWRLRKGGDE